MGDQGLKSKRGLDWFSINLRGCLLIREYFCAVYDYAGKADFSKDYWNPRRKLGVTMHFTEIIKQQ